jgi:hypothetical protein
MSTIPNVDILIFERLSLIPSYVDIDVVLEDLMFLDESMRTTVPSEERLRVLASGLYRRRFFECGEECMEMARLFVRLKALHHLDSFRRMYSFINSYKLYILDKQHVDEQHL